MYEGETLIISRVKELPPIDSWRRRVSFESLYGIWLDFSERAWMTLPKVDKDVLIFLAYINIFP